MSQESRQNSQKMVGIYNSSGSNQVINEKTDKDGKSSEENLKFSFTRLDKDKSNMLTPKEFHKNADKAFMELCTERKTLERIQSIVKTGKVLRN